MTTQELIAIVAHNIGDPGMEKVPRKLILNRINEAQLKICRDFHCLESVAYGGTIADTREYTISSTFTKTAATSTTIDDFLAIRHMLWNGYDMGYWMVEDVDEHSSQTGTPSRYYYRNFIIGFEPTPSQGVVATIEGITLSGSDEVSINATAHGLTTGDIVTFRGVGGTTELNGESYTITKTDADNFTLDDTDSSDFTAWTSSGTCYTKEIKMYYYTKPTVLTQASASEEPDIDGVYHRLIEILATADILGTADWNRRYHEEVAEVRFALASAVSDILTMETPE